jgi:hypothetical protein
MQYAPASMQAERRMLPHAKIPKSPEILDRTGFDMSVKRSRRAFPTCFAPLLSKRAKFHTVLAPYENIKI